VDINVLLIKESVPSINLPLLFQDILRAFANLAMKVLHVHEQFVVLTVATMENA